MTHTTRPRLTVAFGLLLALAPQYVAAEDYPFFGLFWPAVGGTETNQLDARCALSFLDQRKDGTWTVYHADLAAFKASGAISYHRISEGACSYNPETKVESCTVIMDQSLPEAAGTSFYDVLLSVDDRMVQTAMIDAADDWKTVSLDAGQVDAAAALNYITCPFPAEALLSRISKAPSTLSADDMNALRFPSDEMLADPDVARLAQTLRGN